MRQRCVRWLMLLLVLAATCGKGKFVSAQAASPVFPAAGARATTPTTPEASALDQLVTQFKIQASKADPKQLITSPSFYIAYLAANYGSQASSTVVTQLLHNFQEQRVDVQVTTSQSAAGSTSTTNKGSVPWLFGLAVENGALTQSTENSQIVLRGNIANAISALRFGDYITSFNKIQEQNVLVRNIAKTSFAVTFQPSQMNSTASPSDQTNTFNGFSAHYDVLNHRDPRDPKWSGRNCFSGTSTKTTKDTKDCVWVPVIMTLQLSTDEAGNFLTQFVNLPAPASGGKKPSEEWADSANKAFCDLVNEGKNGKCQDGAVKCNPGVTLTVHNTCPVDATDKQIAEILKTVGEDLAARVANSPAVLAAEEATVAALLKVSKEKSDAYQTIMSSKVVSFEYTYVRQSASQIPGSTSSTTMTVAAPLPDLSTFNVIYNQAFVGGSQLSVNGIATMFNSLPTGSKSGSIRDAEATLQLDVPLREMLSIGKPTVTLSGVYMDLINQPLGQEILINGVPESRTGSIGLFQGKFTIPAGKGSGVKIPIAFTYANRTELIKESDVRGSVGVTFNFDSIFSKP